MEGSEERWRWKGLEKVDGKRMWVKGGGWRQRPRRWRCVEGGVVAVFGHKQNQLN